MITRWSQDDHRSIRSGSHLDRMSVDSLYNICTMVFEAEQLINNHAEVDKARRKRGKRAEARIGEGGVWFPNRKNGCRLLD
jgi:hypothetical protein